MADSDLREALETLELASSPDEAESRYNAARSADPYPEIPPALLNTADVLSYISATGMIFPFAVDLDEPDKTLKAASCGVRVLGPYLYWSGSGVDAHPDQPVSGTLSENEELVLQRNSIVYVTLEPVFRLPDYIAGRFNLTIRDVYRGMLVGTGPLVDPGFQGQLSLPLHNLTANDYVITGGEPLVWMEFTKVSPHARWDRLPDSVPARSSAFAPFPRRKLDRRSVRNYVRYAHDGPIRSSIPELLGESANAAVKAAEDAKSAASAADAASVETSNVRRTFFRVSLLALAGVVLALAAFLVQVLGYVGDARKDVDASRRETIAVRRHLATQAHVIRALRGDLRRVEARISKLSRPSP